MPRDVRAEWEVKGHKDCIVTARLRDIAVTLSLVAVARDVQTDGAVLHRVSQ